MWHFVKFSCKHQEGLHPLTAPVIHNRVVLKSIGEQSKPIGIAPLLAALEMSANAAGKDPTHELAKSGNSTPLAKMHPSAAIRLVAACPLRSRGLLHGKDWRNDLLPVFTRLCKSLNEFGKLVHWNGLLFGSSAWAFIKKFTNRWTRCSFSLVSFKDRDESTR